MLKFFMVSTVLSKKQFCFVEIYKQEDVIEYINDLAKNHQHVILYPIHNEQDVENISDLIDNDWKKCLLKEIQQDPKVLVAKQLNGTKTIKNVQFIEHVNGPAFLIKGKNKEFTSFNFSLYLE